MSYLVVEKKRPVNQISLFDHLVGCDFAQKYQLNENPHLAVLGNWIGELVFLPVLALTASWFLLKLDSWTWAIQ